MSQAHANIIKVRDVQNPSLIWEIDQYNNTRTMKDEQGQIIKMDLGQTDVHLDYALANYAAGYKQWEGIADEVAPVVPSDKNSNKYYTWDKDDVFQQVEDLIVGPDSAVKEISGRLSNSAFTCVNYGIGASVPTELAANADAALKIEQAYMRRCLNAINIGREQRVATLVTTSTNWTGGYTNTLGATAKWNGGSASDPINDILTAVRGSLTPVSAIAMSEKVWHSFVQNPNVQKYIASKVDIAPMGTTSFGAETLAQVNTQFGAVLGLPPILVGRMKKKSTSSTYDYVWGTNVALICRTPGLPSDGQSIATCKTFRWTGADAAATDGSMVGGFLVRTYFDPRRGGRGTRVMVVTHNDTEVMTSVYAGGLIINAWQ